MAWVFITQGFSQESRGMLTGRVTDASGAIVAGVTVRAVQTQTRLASSTTTNNDGLYQIRYLLPGRYDLTAEYPGFKTTARSGIEIRVNDRVELNLTLEVGSIGEKVEVVGETPILETTSASMGQVVDHRRITELPLLHGNPMAVLEMAAGIAQARTSDLGLWGGRVFDNGWTTSFAIAGSSSNTHEITLDGVSNTTTLGGAGGAGRQTVAYTPPADLVQEFKVQTATFDASVGYTSGAVINMSVKPGTRDFHGTTYYFKILPELNANQWFANRAAQPKVNFGYNRWGVTNTGPVYIPKIYNGREHTFYSYGYEGHHDSPPWPQTLTVPTPKQLGGDFSALLAVGSRYQIYDPYTAQLLPNGRIERQPFPNNVIPASRISPFAKTLSSYWGAPRVAGAEDGTNNFPDPSQPDPNLYFSHVARIDHNISSANRLYGRVDISKNIEQNYRDQFKNPATGNNLIRRNRGVALDDVHTFSPGLVLNVRYGYTRFREDTVPKSVGFDSTQLGFDKALMAQIDPQAYVFPCIAVQGYASLGCNNPNLNATDVHTFTAAFDSLRGAHNMKFGADVRAYRKTRFGIGQGVPRVEFGSNFTRQFDNSPAAPIGQGLASFLLGVYTGGYLDRNASFAEQSKGYSLFFQDDWKVNRKLTVTLGLRYEYEGPLTERFNRSVGDYDFSAPSPIEGAVRANYARNPIPEIPPDRFRVIGGLRFANVGGLPRGVYEADSNNLMPRAGLAWTVTPKTVVRAGYGVFFGYLGQRRGDVIQSGFSQRTDIIPTLDDGLTYRLNIANPFVDGLLNAPGTSQGLSTFLGRDISYFNPNPVTPYMQRWQLTIQHELPSRVLLDFGYVGNRGTKLEINRNIDALPNQWLSTSPVRDDDRINFLTARITNPFYPLLPGTSLSGTTVPRAQLLTPYPQFASIGVTQNQGYSWYHSLQTRIERRFASGYTFQASYTYSKLMEAMSYLNGADPVPERVISAQDFPHRLTFSGIYELPFGRGKRLLGSASGIAGRMITGWQVQGVYIGQSGQALGFGNAIFQGNLRDIPLPKGQRTVDRWFNTAGFDRNSARQLSLNLRTLNSRFGGVRGDGINTFNLSVIKNTAITEKLRIQFRGEAINAMNHVMFVNPNTNPASSAFGTVADEKSSGRAIQLGLKLLF
ncbi:MAG TPA: TonB-dependent receptor [Bryobacteraceae bacterium]|nr:TonB-dependent receptor [Bryobacteraceae bacterium]